MRAGFLGPEGTFSHEALLAATAGEALEAVPLPTVHDTVLAVQDGRVERALVPIENSMEGVVNATVDTLALEAEDAEITGEVVHPVRLCLVARDALALEDVREVASHPQPAAQCAGWLRAHLPRARVLPATSTAEAVREAVAAGGTRAAVGPEAAAARYGGRVLAGGIEDQPGNATRFVWLARRGDATARPAAPGGAAWKTSVVFWGAGDDQPGWLVRCLSEFAFRGVNLTLILSRPRAIGFGHHMFFVDLDGRVDDPAVGGAVEAVRAQTERLRVLGSYPVAAPAPPAGAHGPA